MFILSQDIWSFVLIDYLNLALSFAFTQNTVTGRWEKVHPFDVNHVSNQMSQIEKSLPTVMWMQLQYTKQYNQLRID